MPNFGAVLDTPASDIKPPPPFPAGPYLCVVQGLPKYDVSSKQKTEFAQYTLQPLQVMEAEMQEGVDAIGGLTDKTINATFYLTEKAIWRLKEFLVNCIGEDEVNGAGTLRESMEAVTGSQVIAYMKHEASDDGKRTFAKFSGSAPVE
jgi:hypothetical protein